MLNQIRCGTSRVRGFTLIELMIALVVVGILSAIAYPNYTEAMRKVRRAEARATLMQLMQQQERYYSQYSLYMPFESGTSNIDAQKFKWYTGTTAKTSAYEIRGVACTGETSRNCITLTAIPGTAKVNSSYSDPTCGSLTLSSNGVKATVPVTPAGRCW